MVVESLASDTVDTITNAARQVCVCVEPLSVEPVLSAVSVLFALIMVLLLVLVGSLLVLVGSLGPLPPTGILLIT